MAELAEVIQLHEVYPPSAAVFDGSLAVSAQFESTTLSLLPPLGEITEPALPVFQSADFIPELAFTRERARREALSIMAEHQQLVENGQGEAPLAVDALGTGKLVVEAEKDFGLDSPERELAFAGLVLDCERLLGEAYRANTWEYFGESEQVYDVVTDDFYSNGISLGQLNHNGLVPSGSEEEDGRRINEAVEEIGTYQSLGKMILGKSLEVQEVSEQLNVATVSQCTQEAIDTYKAGKKTGFGGYVPSIEKVMFRNARFDTKTGSRFQEQVGVSGKLITPVINLGLTILDARLDGQMDRTTAHGTQIVTDAKVGALDYVELFDLLATEYHGFDVFMGERLPAGQTRDYEAVKVEARQRQEELHDKAVWLAGRVVELEQRGVKHRVGNAIIEAEVQEMALKDCRQEPELARIIFDDRTYRGFVEVQRLENLGEIGQAQSQRQEVEANAPAVQFCGAGSCGLEKVSEISREASEGRKLGLKGDQLLHDKVRACPECSKLTVHYDKQANKVCTNPACQFRKVNGKISGGKKHDR